MAIPDKIYKVVAPKSESDSNWEDFEYMLVWIGVNSQPNWWLFYDKEVLIRTKGEQINLDDPDLISTIFDEQRKNIILVAEDLDSEQCDYVESITRSAKIWRLYKDGTTEQLSISPIDYDYVKSDQRRDFEIRLNEENRRVAR